MKLKFKVEKRRMKEKSVRFVVFGLVLLLLASGIGTATAFSDTKEEQSLVAYWAFDEGSGTTVYDSSGNGNDGTIHGAAWTTGISGKALSFDGADDYVEIPHKNSLDISNEITIGVWIRIASATSGIILEKDVIGTGLNDWTLGIGEGKPYFIVGVNYKNYNLKSPISVDDNNWHYIAVRRDFNGLLQLDVDGVEVASENFPKGSISNSESIHIGCWDTPRGIESFFEGTVDELYIYNQALSDEEIEVLYKGLITPTPTPRQTPIPMPSTVDFAQHSATDSGDFVILTNDGKVYEVDPRHLSDIQLRTSAGPVNVAAVIPDLYDDSILAFAGDGKLYQCKDSENWANWNKVGDINLPSGSKMVDFAQHSAADSGDFVILTNDGRVYEVDPRHLSDIQLRTAAGPVNVAAVIPDRYDNSILAVTSGGVLYRATTDDDWKTWTEVGRVQLSVGSKIVDFAQHSAVITGDFVFLTDDGKVYEVDPRRLSIFEFRTANGPSNVVAMKPNTYDNSILALTDSGVLYRAITDDDWNTWTQVGRIQFPTPTLTPTPTPTQTPTAPTPPAGKLKAVWLYNPDKYDTATLMSDSKSAGINTIFLSTDVNNIWKYERFVKSAHENGIEVHAMILEDPRCALKENHASAIKAVEAVLNYNDKSLAKFDGINIDTEPYVDLDLEQVWRDYITLLETIHEKTAGKTILSADIPRWYDEGKIKDLAPNVDFFVIMAYDSGGAGWNTASEIEDAVASEMGAIRGEDSDAVIGIGVHERFGDKEAVGECVDELYSYYSGDPAFLGVSIFKYESYSGLASAPEVTVPTGEEKGIRGFEAIFAVAGLLAVAYIFKRRK